MAKLPANPPAEITAKYNKDGQVLRRTMDSSLEHRVDIEIGDETRPNDFHPFFKIKKWDDEVNFNIDFDLPGAGNEKATFEGEATVWEKNGYKVRQYDKPSASEEGGFEYEVIIPSRPPVSSVTLKINFKNCTFHFQPPLTQQEIDDGASRPANVDGSYAVYATGGRKNHKVGEKNYRTGKFCHIYRPHLVDATGTNETWADMVIDEQAKTLTISVDPVWLDNAVYPVTLDPTLGYTTAGATAQTIENSIQGSQSTASQNGVVTSWTISHQTSTQSKNVKCALYTSSDSALQSPQSEQRSIPSGSSKQWQTFNPASSPGPSLANGTAYAIEAWSSSGSGNSEVFWDNVGSNNGRAANVTFGTWPNPATFTTQDRDFSNYVTYDVSGDMTGSSAGSATASGTLTGKGALAGTATAVASPTAGLTGKGALAGASAGVATVTGTGLAIGKLEGTIPGAATVSGTLKGSGSLAGTSPGASTVDGVLQGAGALVGSSAGSSTVSGTLEDAGAEPSPITGSSAGVSTVSGTLIGIGSLAGAPAGVSTVSGALTGVGSLAGSISGVSTASAQGQASGALVGQTSGSVTVAGLLRGTGALAGSSTAGSTVSGTLTDIGSGDISGVSSGSAVVTATLIATGALAGSSPGSTTVSGVLEGLIQASGLAMCTSTVSGTLVGTGQLTGVSAGSSSLAGLLGAIMPIYGLAIGVAIVTGILGIPIDGPNENSGNYIRLGHGHSISGRNQNYIRVGKGHNVS